MPSASSLITWDGLVLGRCCCRTCGDAVAAPRSSSWLQLTSARKQLSPPGGRWSCCCCCCRKLPSGVNVGRGQQMTTSLQVLFCSCCSGLAAIIPDDGTLYLWTAVRGLSVLRISLELLELLSAALVDCSSSSCCCEVWSPFCALVVAVGSTAVQLGEEGLHIWEYSSRLSGSTRCCWSDGSCSRSLSSFMLGSPEFTCCTWWWSLEVVWSAGLLLPDRWDGWSTPASTHDLGGNNTSFFPDKRWTYSSTQNTKKPTIWVYSSSHHCSKRYILDCQSCGGGVWTWIERALISPRSSAFPSLGQWPRIRPSI